MLTTWAQAKRENAAACFLRPPVLVDDAVFALTTDDTAVLHPHWLVRAWLRTRWQIRHLAEIGAARGAAGSASFWHELYRELRRHIGNEQLPISLRGRLRTLAERSFANSVARTTDGALLRVPRRLISERINTYLPEELAVHAREAAAELGIIPDTPIVAIDIRLRPEAFFDTVDALAGQRCTIVRLGNPGLGPIRRRGVIDLTTSPQRDPLLEVFVLLHCQFVVCASSDVQWVSYLTNTPCLTVNAGDPFSLYPVRPDGLYLLRNVIDLDTGRTLGLEDLLSERYFRNLRNYGYRDNASEEIVDAVNEMQDGLKHGWHETDGQRRYRTLVAQAGADLAPRVPYVARWGPDSGFIGEGRVTRAYADRVM